MWIGWSGDAGRRLGPFEVDGLHLVGMGLSAEQVRDYYEGFCNATLWPLYHDVIAQPEFHRRWWDAYVTVNRSFAQAAAEQAAPGATVWVHDYQLQLVPQLLREQRGDVRIGFFNHIPFPGYEIFAQLPWRRQVVDGLLGADLLGFQRRGDAANFLRACRRAAGLATRGSTVRAERRDVRCGRRPSRSRSTRRPSEEIARPRRASATERRDQAGPRRSGHWSCSASTGSTTPRAYCIASAPTASCSARAGSGPGTVLVQVASPSRERVEAYRPCATRSS